MDGGHGSIKIVVSFDDTDCSGRVHFSKYSIWIDRAIQEFMRGIGLEFLPDGSLFSKERGEKIAFAIGEYWVRMERPSKLGDRLEALAWPGEVRRRVLAMDGAVRDLADGADVARGRITLVHVDLSTMSALEMPEWLLGALSSRAERGP